MVTLEQRIEAFVKLGDFLRTYLQYRKGANPDRFPLSDMQAFDEIIALAGIKNGWFTEDNVLFALKSWGELLEEETLTTWLLDYAVVTATPKNVAIIMAGNIPLVGFHDLLAVLITGNKALIKPSSNDTDLLPFLLNKLESFAPFFKGYTQLVEGQLTAFDAVIATGSNNTARYFEYYFGQKPHIIRKNRNSAAILRGRESDNQLNELGEDIFRYFGLGCRSVSKLFVPKGYDFSSFFEAIEPYRSLLDHHKYHNNYDYNKAVYLMSEFHFLDNGFFILKEDEGFASPIGSVFYEHYTSEDALRIHLNNQKDNLQCVVADNFLKDEVAFGKTQSPTLSDYADGIDTVEFLLKRCNN